MLMGSRSGESPSLEDRGTSVPAVCGGSRPCAGAGEEQGGFEPPPARGAEPLPLSIPLPRGCKRSQFFLLHPQFFTVVPSTEGGRDGTKEGATSEVPRCQAGFAAGKGSSLGFWGWGGLVP